MKSTPSESRTPMANCTGPYAREQAALTRHEVDSLLWTGDKAVDGTGAAWSGRRIGKPSFFVGKGAGTFDPFSTVLFRMYCYCSVFRRHVDVVAPCADGRCSAAETLIA